jgi:adenylate cyclase
MDDPRKLNLGGQKKELTVMFSDVRGFTTISERMGAAELATFMNNYLTPMTEIVIENRGTIDKYMGDAIMAIFGAPVAYDEHPAKAVDAGLQMLEKLDRDLKPAWRAQGLPEVDIGIGVNTGDMSVGNMGSNRIFAYTVMGDAVNLGSRIEGINKEYKTRLIVSEFTRKYLGPDYVCRELDRVKVKGKVLPVTIFEVMAKGPGHDHLRLRAQKFEAALALYYAQKFLEAEALFRGLEAEDPTSGIYVERCVEWRAEPPGADWDGSWTMKSK